MDFMMGHMNWANQGMRMHEEIMAENARKRAAENQRIQAEKEYNDHLNKEAALEQEIVPIRGKFNKASSVFEKLIRVEGFEKTVDDILVDEAQMQLLLGQINERYQVAEQKASEGVRQLQNEITELELQKASEIKLHDELLEKMGEL